MGERGGEAEAPMPAVIRAANLGSAKIGDVSPLRAGVSARVVDAYTVSRRIGSGRVMDVMV